MNVLIYGFGRMGMTHYSILNSLRQDINFYIIENNNVIRNLLSKNINARFFKNDKKLKIKFDLTLITTPPFIHLELLKNCVERGDSKIFVEKPFGGHLNQYLKNFAENEEIFIGYVLRFNPCVQWVKSEINPNNIKNISCTYFSNTIEKKPKGWRNSNFSGVLNEMGSHLIDLVFYLTDFKKVNLLNSSIKSVVSDVDDIVKATFESCSSVKIDFHFNWVKKAIRKPVFEIKIELIDNTYFIFDQQIINKYDSSGKKVLSKSVAELNQKVPYYLRGVDFTLQMMDLLGERKILATAKDAFKVNLLMKQIIENENNIR